jgi:predicted AAA+ superfamily ATPase
MTLVPRRIEPLVDEALGGFRVVVVNGPRQAGKSTLLGLVAGSSDAAVLTMDDRPTLRLARTDPAGFVEGYPHPLFVDEIQRAGDPLVLAIKAWVDRHPNERGQFLLTGSSRFLTVPSLSESLAGRVRILDLWPFSQGEIEGTPDGLVDLLFESPDQIRHLDVPRLSRHQAMERVVLGGFPPVHDLNSHRLRTSWFADYRRTLVQRDLSELRRIRQGVDLPRLFRLVASLTAQELNVASLARALDLSSDTVRDYLALLETIYVHHTLPAWSGGMVSRAKRRPKLHMVDSGLCAATLGLDAQRLAVPTEGLAGPVLETFVVGELRKQQSWSQVDFELLHFRDRKQREVDVVLEATDGRIVAVEIKAAVDVDDHDVRHLGYLREILADRFVHGIVLHLGHRPMPLGDRLTALPLSSLWAAG